LKTAEQAGLSEKENSSRSVYQRRIEENFKLIMIRPNMVFGKKDDR
jgi:hypothetical protein